MKNFFPLILCTCLLSNVSYSQVSDTLIKGMVSGSDTSINLSVTSPGKAIPKSIATKKNVAKVNLAAVAVFKNFSFQYERVLSRKTSVALGFAILPKTGLPFKSTLIDKFGDDEDARRAIESTKLSNFSITPEFRFYLGRKGAPAGFYIAPFVRYNHLSFEQGYSFTASSGKVYDPLINGSINTIGAGILFGVQWNLSKSITLDWWIAGPNYGSINGNLHGVAAGISDIDANELEKDIEDVDLPLIKTDATVTPQAVDVKLSGSYAGLRAFGICIGVKF